MDTYPTQMFVSFALLTFKAMLNVRYSDRYASDLLEEREFCYSLKQCRSQDIIPSLRGKNTAVSEEEK